METEGATGRVCKKREYNSTVKKLQQQLCQLTQLLQWEREKTAAANEEMMLLAEAIVQHKVLFALMHPLQHKAMQQASTGIRSSVLHHPWLSQVKHELQQKPSTHWATMLKLAMGSNPMLSPALKATAEQVHALAALDEDGVRQFYMLTVNNVLMLTELLSPDRYPPALLYHHKQQQRQQQQQNPCAADSDTGSTQAAAAAAEAMLWGAEVKTAAAKLLNYLKSYKQLMNEVMRVTMLLVLHASGCGSQLLYHMGDLNFETGQHESPPCSHYLQAIRRLRLTSRQVQQLQLMHKQYNRMARQQYHAGQQLVRLLDDSFTLQAAAASSSLSSRPSSQQRNGWSSDGPCSGAQQQLGMDICRGVLPEGAGQAGSSSSEPCSIGRMDAQEEEEGSAALEEQLLKHVHNHLDLLSVVGLWAINTLSPWQIGEFLVACMPYYPWAPVLLELSPLLTPCDTPPVAINTNCCEAAAQAAALAAELGFMDARAYMANRCRALEDQLQYLLEEGLYQGP